MMIMMMMMIVKHLRIAINTRSSGNIKCDQLHELQNNERYEEKRKNE